MGKSRTRGMSVFCISPMDHSSVCACIFAWKSDQKIKTERCVSIFVEVRSNEWACPSPSHTSVFFLCHFSTVPRNFCSAQHLHLEHLRMLLYDLVDQSAEFRERIMVGSLYLILERVYLLVRSQILMCVVLWIDLGLPLSSWVVF